MLKKLVLLIIFAIGAAGLSSQNASAATTPPSIYVDGNLLSLSNKPIVKDGTTLIPVREIAQKLGLKVVFDSSNNIISFKHPYRSTDLTHKIGGNKICTDTFKCQTLQSNSVEISGVTYVPIRLFEAFDATVFWDSAKNSIYVYTYELKQLQAVTFANLAYDYALPIGKDLKDVNFNNMPEVNNTFKSVQEQLSIYTKDINGNPITTDKFVKNYARLGEWELATYLQPSDFSSSSEYKQMRSDGFQGYAFRNYKTNEFMIAFRGTEWSLGDITTDTEIAIKRINYQKQYAFKLFQKVTTNYNKPTIYLTGHSLGGNLVQATAANFPKNYKQAYTFNAAGTNNYSLTTKVVNSRIYTDPVSSIYSHYGRTFVFNIRPYENHPVKEPLNNASHRLFNFYSYYYLPSTKYWGTNIPYRSGFPNYLWAY
ncbi:stalk domain-containing protein [Priestia megaterium]|uniref:stalk domain-containing protein n=1 Tax=Priestia megaterium TaxID=1404 RepID=UPI0014949778|nr:stalk domain-containing protein [Priestia megaterium]